MLKTKAIVVLVMLGGCTQPRPVDDQLLPIVVSCTQGTHTEQDAFEATMGAEMWDRAVGEQVAVYAELGEQSAVQAVTRADRYDVAHEIGLELGLPVSSDPRSVMHDPPGREVTAEDVEAVEKVWR